MRRLDGITDSMHMSFSKIQILSLEIRSSGVILENFAFNFQVDQFKKLHMI